MGKCIWQKNKETGEIVALKKIRMDNEKEGFPITAIREIKILKELHNENIVQLKEIVTSKATKENRGKQSIYMVFEYMDHDLTGLMMSEGSLWKPTQAQIKCYMKQLLVGLHHCHNNGVLHRDIKGSNLLISNKGQLKLADFGLARPYTENQGNYTNRVITLWYRPPELLLGAVQYGPPIDMWSAGCILAELLGKKAIFPGRNEIDQLELIFKLCGTPNQENWPDVDKLEWWHMFKPQKPYKRCLRETFSHFPREAVDLIDRMLTLDPKQRITASEALDADYFWIEPLPCAPEDLPKYPSSHEFQAKKRRNAQHQQQQSQNIDISKRQKGPQGAPVYQHPPSNSGNNPYSYPPRNGPPNHPSGRGYGRPPQSAPPYQGSSHGQPPYQPQYPFHQGGGGGYHNRGPPPHGRPPPGGPRYPDQGPHPPGSHPPQRSGLPPPNRSLDRT